METESEIDTVHKLVMDLLAKDMRCRNDDKYLTFRVMQHYTKIYIPFEDFNKIPAFETIKRCRAKIQNNYNLYLPTDPEVIARRSNRRKVFREVFRNENGGTI